MVQQEIPGQMSFDSPERKDAASEPPLPTPVRPGESDTDASRRNARAFREWEPQPPASFDPNVASDTLRRLERGDYSPPETPRQ